MEREVEFDFAAIEKFKVTVEKFSTENAIPCFDLNPRSWGRYIAGVFVPNEYDVSALAEIIKVQYPNSSTASIWLDPPKYLIENSIKIMQENFGVAINPAQIKGLYLQGNRRGLACHVYASHHLLRDANFYRIDNLDYALTIMNDHARSKSITYIDTVLNAWALYDRGWSIRSIAIHLWPQLGLSEKVKNNIYNAEPHLRSDMIYNSCKNKLSQEILCAKRAGTTIAKAYLETLRFNHYGKNHPKPEFMVNQVWLRNKIKPILDACVDNGTPVESCPAIIEAIEELKNSVPTSKKRTKTEIMDRIIEFPDYVGTIIKYSLGEEVDIGDAKQQINDIDRTLTELRSVLNSVNDDKMKALIEAILNYDISSIKELTQC